MAQLLSKVDGLLLSVYIIMDSRFDTSFCVNIILDALRCCSLQRELCNRNQLLGAYLHDVDITATICRFGFRLLVHKNRTFALYVLAIKPEDQFDLLPDPYCIQLPDGLKSFLYLVYQMPFGVYRHHLQF